MIRFRLDPRSGVSTYLQIAHQVRHALRLGMLRPGDQLDHRLNPTLAPTFIEFGGAGGAGGNFPSRFFSSTDYFIHGINFGVEVKF